MWIFRTFRKVKSCPLWCKVLNLWLFMYKLACLRVHFLEAILVKVVWYLIQFIFTIFQVRLFDLRKKQSREKKNYREQHLWTSSIFILYSHLQSAFLVYFWLLIPAIFILQSHSDYLDRKITVVTVKNIKYATYLKVKILAELRAYHVTYKLKISSMNLMNDNGQPTRKPYSEYGPLWLVDQRPASKLWRQF